MSLLNKKTEAISDTCRFLIRQTILRHGVYVGKKKKSVLDGKEIEIPDLADHELNPQITLTLQFHFYLWRYLNEVVNNYDSFALGYMDLL